MRFGRLSLRHEGVLGIGRQVVSLFLFTTLALHHTEVPHRSSTAKVIGLKISKFQMFHIFPQLFRACYPATSCNSNKEIVVETRTVIAQLNSYALLKHIQQV